MAKPSRATGMGPEYPFLGTFFPQPICILLESGACQGGKALFKWNIVGNDNKSTTENAGRTYARKLHDQRPMQKTWEQRRRARNLEDED